MSIAEPVLLSADALVRALRLRDLTDPAQGPHALQTLIERVLDALAQRWRVPAVIHRQSALVHVADNYDRLGYPADGAARDARYTRYVSSVTLLRTHTSAMIPPLLRVLRAAPPRDVLLACPGVVYRRDCIDRLHTGEPHQLDLWRVRSEGPPLDDVDLDAMIVAVGEALVPGAPLRTQPATHPYTLRGRQIDAHVQGQWLEIGECGIASPVVLAEAGMPASTTGLAMGLGLDRLLMARKGLDDVRLLRALDPRVAVQMLDLAPYRPVSSQPAIRRDLSIALAADDLAEDLGDRVREALGERAASLESVELLARTAYEALQPAARERLGIAPEQTNALVRVVIRDLDRTLTSREANALRDLVYAALHRGSAHEWAAR